MLNGAAGSRSLIVVNSLSDCAAVVARGFGSRALQVNCRTLLSDAIRFEKQRGKDRELGSRRQMLMEWKEGRRRSKR